MQPPALSVFQREPKPSQAKEDIISPPTHNNSESELWLGTQGSLQYKVS